MVSVRKPVDYHQAPLEYKDMLVVHLPKLKFVTIELDEDLLEFKIVCLQDFENKVQLQETGKVYPRQGFLQSFFIETTPIMADEAQLKTVGGESIPRKRGRKPSDHQ